MDLDCNQANQLPLRMSSVKSNQYGFRLINKNVYNTPLIDFVVKSNQYGFRRYIKKLRKVYLHFVKSNQYGFRLIFYFYV